MEELDEEAAFWRALLGEELYWLWVLGGEALQLWLQEDPARVQPAENDNPPPAPPAQAPPSRPEAQSPAGAVETLFAEGVPEEERLAPADLVGKACLTPWDPSEPAAYDLPAAGTEESDREDQAAVAAVFALYALAPLAPALVRNPANRPGTRGANPCQFLPAAG
jgi:hypothetical protein